MGNHPIPLAQHEGWVCAVILEGTPVTRQEKSQNRQSPYKCSWFSIEYAMASGSIQRPAFALGQSYAG
jgi:hypothetical protein